MHDMADTAFANQLRAAVERTLDSGHRLHREAALWPPGRRGERLQPRQAWSSIARVSHLFCGQQSTFAANSRLVLDVEVQAGNQTASSYAQPI